MKCILAPFNPSTVSEYFDTSVVLPNINVTASSINNIVKGLLNLNEHLLVVTTSMEDTSNTVYVSDKIKIIVVGCYKPFILCRLFPNLKSLADKIYKAIVPYKNEISLLHAHWCYEFALAASRFDDGIPVYCTVRDWAPVIYDSISSFNSLYSFLAKFYWRYKITIMYKVLSNSKINFIANSEYTCRLLNEEGIKGCVIHNSISEDLIIENIPTISCRNNIVSIAGSIDDNRKNIKTLIDAFEVINKRFPSCHLILVGDYHLNKGIHKLVKEKRLLSSVTFTGRLNRKDVMKQIDASFCMIHPALEETFGNILIEAMARGVFCIGGVASGAVPHVLGQGKYGLTCDISSSADIVNAFNSLKDNTIQYEVMRYNALSNVKKSYSNDVIAYKHIRLYSEIRVI